MDNLLRGLEELTISGNFAEKIFWERCVELIKRTFVPIEPIGIERPCEEKDFREYRATITRNLENIQSITRRLLDDKNERIARGVACVDYDSSPIKDFAINLTLLIGEHSEKSIWNTLESVEIAKNILDALCNFFGFARFSDFLTRPDDKFDAVLIALRPKLLKETWKCYPAAIVCYKWLLCQIKHPILSEKIATVLPTALIILDDFVPENRVVGLECIRQILRHSCMKKELMENGYADVIYDALKRLTHQRDVRYIVPLYNCFPYLLLTSNFYNDVPDNFEWTKLDDIIATLLDNMECEQDMELRHAYILSLPEVLMTDGCAKWLERLTRILAEYCGNQTDLRTLKVTLEVAEKIIVMFSSRLRAHCAILYTAFLKLHFDLTETPVFDKEIIRSLERCMRILYNMTPDVGEAIMRDNQIRAIIKNSDDLAYFGDPKYCN